MRETRELRVCVVGAGTRFLSGMSYYTLHLINALACHYRVSAILMRQLLPTRLYPGWKRVGKNLTRLQYDLRARVFDGVDWYWLPGMVRALALLLDERPDVVVFQWWSGTVLHSYLLLALVARLLGARTIIEFHEVLDPAEAKLPPAQAYVRLLAPLLLRLTHGFVIHSQYDKKLLHSHYNLGQRPVAMIGHGPYNHYHCSGEQREAIPTSCCNLLFFGLIRPYKGLDDLIRAFDALPEDEIDGYWLTVVGETWEGWNLPATLIEGSRYRERITFVNRYVSDEEVACFFGQADALVLPYHRASASGPLHIGMSCGLPIVATRVGGLCEAIAGYDGAILVEPEDLDALQDGLRQAREQRGKRYSDPHSWEQTVAGYHTLFDTLLKERNNRDGSKSYQRV
jgi:glycosyltransferase involved in cell wall biosynthesis